MKYLFIILVISGVLVQVAGKLFILVEFQLNREYIAKNLCVQKKIKNNCCKGSCHLKKELAKEQKKEQNPLASFLKDKGSSWLSKTGGGMRLHLPESGQPGLTPYRVARLVSISFAVFHPPSC